MTETPLSTGELTQQVGLLLGVPADAVRLSPLAAGCQAICYAVSASGSSGEGPSGEHVLKVYREDYPYATPTAVRHEYETLKEFFAATSRVPAISSPAAMGMCGDRAYLMGRVPGRPLARLLDDGGLSPQLRFSVVKALYTGLRLFHDTLGEAYGDFHPENVFVDSQTGTVAMIDPCMANREYYQPAQWASNAPISVDLAYWVFSESARSWRTWPVAPRATHRRLGFTKALIGHAASIEGEALRAAVGQVVAWHARRFRQRHGLPSSLVGTYGRVVARSTMGV